MSGITEETDGVMQPALFRKAPELNGIEHARWMFGVAFDAPHILLRRPREVCRVLRAFRLEVRLRFVYGQQLLLIKALFRQMLLAEATPILLWPVSIA